jgi:hypothetical protein
MRLAGGRAGGAATGNRRGKAAPRRGARSTTITLSVRSKASRREDVSTQSFLNVHAPCRGALNARDCSGGSTSGAATGYLQSPLRGVSDSRRIRSHSALCRRVTRCPVDPLEGRFSLFWTAVSPTPVCRTRESRPTLVRPTLESPADASGYLRRPWKGGGVSRAKDAPLVRRRDGHTGQQRLRRRRRVRHLQNRSRRWLGQPDTADTR